MAMTFDPAVREQAEGEWLEADARLVVAPSNGVFEPAADVRAGSQIVAGQVIGQICSSSGCTPVVSPFSGHAGAALAWQGERLITHQPVLWLSLSAPEP